MKKNTHPDYYKNAAITCACGNKIVTGSTVEKISIELCSQCHPFFTGKQKLVDTARRVEKFQARVAQKQAAAEVRKGKKVKRAAKAKAKQVKDANQPEKKSLK